MITEAIQATVAITQVVYRKAKECEMRVHIYIYLPIFNNRHQRNVLLFVHNTQRQTKNYTGIFNSCRLLHFPTK